VTAAADSTAPGVTAGLNIATFSASPTPSVPVTPSGPLSPGPGPGPVVPELPAPAGFPVPGSGSSSVHDAGSGTAAYASRRSGDLFDSLYCGRVPLMDGQVVARPSTIVVPPG
jgi:hypothetical protein